MSRMIEVALDHSVSACAHAAARRAWWGLARLAAVLLALAMLVWFLDGGGWASLAGLMVSAAVLAVVSLRLGIAIDAMAQARAREAYWQRARDRVAGLWDHGQWDGADACATWHPYARDCDVIGRHGLFALLNTCGSRLGAERLLGELLDDQRWADPARRTAIAALRDHPQWRAALACALAEEGRSLREDASLQAAVEADLPPAPPWAWGLVVPLALAWGLIALAAWQGGGIAAVVIALVVATALAPLDGLALRGLPSADPSAVLRGLRAWRAACVEARRCPVAEGALARDEAALAAGSRALDRLIPVIARLAQNQNPLWRFGPGALSLASWRAAAAWRRWRATSSAALHSTRAALAELEVLAAIATYADEQGGCLVAESTGREVFAAEELAHPLLPRAQRVGNTIDVQEGGVLLLTGANASGKSTLLRSVALAVVLARIGAPVCAASCRLQPLGLATAMRVADDLWSGLSRFQAEVRALKQCLDHGADGRPLLYAFDEILAGTNSRERHEGTRAILAFLRERRGTVLVTTHDLALAELASEEPERYQLAHFADRDVAGDIVFDYRLRPGVLQTTNALRVMRAAGLPV